MKFPEWLTVYGDQSYRGDCPKEHVEQMSFFNKIRSEYPDTFGAIAIHPRNEGLVSKGQFSTMAKKRAEGMTKGASDILIPASPAFVCEIKRQNHVLSSWQDGQIEYLEAAQKLGSFVCVALGAVAAWEAFKDYLEIHYANQ